MDSKVPMVVRGKEEMAMDSVVPTVVRDKEEIAMLSVAPTVDKEEIVMDSKALVAAMGDGVKVQKTTMVCFMEYDK